MKEVAGRKWVIRVVGFILASFLALPSYAQLMLAHEGHHSGGDCTINTGDFPVAFNAFEVPPGNLPPLHAFCDEMPNLGKVNLSIELTAQSSRKIPLAVRLIKVGHDGHGTDGHADAAPARDEEENSEIESGEEAHAGHDADSHESDEMDEHAGHDDAGHEISEHGLVYMPAEKHISGMIVVTADIEEAGQYAILLEREDEAGNVRVAVEIPIYIGGGGHGGHGGGFGMMEIIILLALAGGGAFYYIRQKKQKEESEAAGKS
jgi:hypothetical protein